MLSLWRWLKWALAAVAAVAVGIFMHRRDSAGPSVIDAERDKAEALERVRELDAKAALDKAYEEQQQALTQSKTEQIHALTQDPQKLAEALVAAGRGPRPQ